MITIQVSSKGQITIPAAIRKQLGLVPGARVEIELRGNEIALKRVRSVREVRGIFHEAAKGITADWETVRTETERIVAEQVAREGLE